MAKKKAVWQMPTPPTIEEAGTGRNARSGRGGSMKPTPIIELVGKDVDGIVVDIRTVNPDGSLRYPHQVSPIMVTLRKVQIVRKEGHKWLRWEWDGYSCNYSGLRMDALGIESNCLMMPEVK